MHVDADLYQSYKTVLENLYDLVVPGGLIIFDDVINEKTFGPGFPGAKLAVEEFFSKKIDTFKESISGNYYYIKP